VALRLTRKGFYTYKLTLQSFNALVVDVLMLMWRELQCGDLSILVEGAGHLCRLAIIGTSVHYLHNCESLIQRHTADCLPLDVHAEVRLNTDTY